MGPVRLGLPAPDDDRADAFEVVDETVEVAVRTETPGTATYVVWDEEREELCFAGEEYITNRPVKRRLEPHELPKPWRERLPRGLSWMQFDFWFNRTAKGSFASRIERVEKALRDFQEEVLAKQLELREESSAAPKAERRRWKSAGQMVSKLREKFRREFPSTDVGPALLEDGAAGEPGTGDRPSWPRWVCVTLHPYHQYRPWCLAVRSKWNSTESDEAKLREGLGSVGSLVGLVLYHAGLAAAEDASGGKLSLPKDPDLWADGGRVASLPSLLWPATFAAEDQTEKVKRNLEEDSVFCLGILTKGAIEGARNSLADRAVSDEAPVDGWSWRWESELDPVIRSVVESDPVVELVREVSTGRLWPRRKAEVRRDRLKKLKGGAAKGEAAGRASEGELAARKALSTEQPVGAAGLEALELASSEPEWEPEVVERMDEYARAAALKALAGPRELLGYPKVDGTHTNEPWLGKPVGELAKEILLDALNAADQRISSRKESGEAPTLIEDSPDGSVAGRVRTIEEALFDLASGELGLDDEDELFESVAGLLSEWYRQGDLELLMAVRSALERHEGELGGDHVTEILRRFERTTGQGFSAAVEALGPDDSPREQDVR